MPKRKLHFRTAADAVAEARRLLEGGYRPAGSWDLYQTCTHLALAMEGSTRGHVFAMSLGQRLKALIVKPMILGWRHIPGGFPAPKGARPDESGDAAAALERMQAAFELVERSTSFGTHPVMGPLSVEQWRAFHLIHAEHHLGHLLPT